MAKDVMFYLRVYREKEEEEEAEEEEEEIGRHFKLFDEL